MLLQVLAEAVNVVADWPLYEALCADEPARLTVGYVVGPHEWRFPITEIRRCLPEVMAKRDQLQATLRRAKPLPLGQFPQDRLARELYIRCALLTSASEASRPEARQATCHWITTLGRLRSTY